MMYNLMIGEILMMLDSRKQLVIAERLQIKCVTDEKIAKTAALISRRLVTNIVAFVPTFI